MLSSFPILTDYIHVVQESTASALSPCIDHLHWAAHEWRGTQKCIFHCCVCSPALISATVWQIWEWYCSIGVQDMMLLHTKTHVWNMFRKWDFWWSSSKLFAEDYVLYYLCRVMRCGDDAGSLGMKGERVEAAGGLQRGKRLEALEVPHFQLSNSNNKRK